MNLVINAMQAISAGPREGERGKIRRVLLLRVQDTGPGIPADKLAEIFDPYFTTKAEGSGLGLWIAQQIATAHGGARGRKRARRRRGLHADAAAASERNDP